MDERKGIDVSARVQLLKVIADETRLRILGLLAEKERTGVELAHLLDLSAPTVSHHMRKLTSSGIVTGTEDAQRVIYRLNAALLRDVKRGDDSPGSRTAPTDDREKTLRNFFDGERLTSIPAKRKQRVIVLQKLLERFEPGRKYPEKEINDLLRVAHEDVATLRRELVDYGFMVRENGIYEVAASLPPRSPQVAQEITGDEQEWLAGLLSSTIRGMC